jgi:hypothetical protein
VGDVPTNGVDMTLGLNVLSIGSLGLKQICFDFEHRLLSCVPKST